MGGDWDKVSALGNISSFISFKRTDQSKKISNTCPEESVAEKKGEDDCERGDDVGGQKDHSLAQNCKTDCMSAVKVRMKGRPS